MLAATDFFTVEVATWHDSDDAETPMWGEPISGSCAVNLRKLSTPPSLTAAAATGSCNPLDSRQGVAHHAATEELHGDGIRAGQAAGTAGRYEDPPPEIPEC